MANPSKRKGSSFESAVAGYLAEALQDDGIERRTLAGVNDRGDIAGVKIGDKRAVIECKACQRFEPSKWLREAETERRNDGAAFGVVVAKRKGVGAANMGQQMVMLTLEQFTELVKVANDG